MINLMKIILGRADPAKQSRERSEEEDQAWAIILILAFGRFPMNIECKSRIRLTWNWRKSSHTSLPAVNAISR